MSTQKSNIIYHTKREKTIRFLNGEHPLLNERVNTHGTKYCYPKKLISWYECFFWYSLSWWSNVKKLIQKRVFASQIIKQKVETSFFFCTKQCKAHTNAHIQKTQGRIPIELKRWIFPHSDKFNIDNSLTSQYQNDQQKHESNAKARSIVSVPVDSMTTPFRQIGTVQHSMDNLNFESFVFVGKTLEQKDFLIQA